MAANIVSWPMIARAETPAAVRIRLPIRLRVGPVIVFATMTSFLGIRNSMRNTTARDTGSANDSLCADPPTRGHTHGGGQAELAHIRAYVDEGFPQAGDSLRRNQRPRNENDGAARAPRTWSWGRSASCIRLGSRR